MSTSTLSGLGRTLLMLKDMACSGLDAVEEERPVGFQLTERATVALAPPLQIGQCIDVARAGPHACRRQLNRATLPAHANRRTGRIAKCRIADHKVAAAVAAVSDDKGRVAALGLNNTG